MPSKTKLISIGFYIRMDCFFSIKEIIPDYYSSNLE